MTIEIVDPRAEPGQPVEPYELSIDVTDGPVTIGMLANGFPDSVNFLDHLAKALGDMLPSASFQFYDKGNASAIVSDEMLSGIESDCQAVVAAYGH